MWKNSSSPPTTSSRSKQWTTILSCTVEKRICTHAHCPQYTTICSTPRARREQMNKQTFAEEEETDSSAINRLSRISVTNHYPRYPLPTPPHIHICHRRRRLAHHDCGVVTQGRRGNVGWDARTLLHRGPSLPLPPPSCLFSSPIIRPASRFHDPSQHAGRKPRLERGKGGLSY